MTFSRVLSAAVVLLASVVFAEGKPAAAAAPAAKKAGESWLAKVESGKDLWATMSTTEGDVVIKLFTKDAPKTVANFVGLGTGEKEFTDPKTGAPAKRPFYDGVIFHRVIPEFMIQGGDPEGTGRGGPGYKFADEFQSGRKFDKVGLLAMANAGPATNGSQFFITTSLPGYLNNKHTIFGEVVSGYDVVVKIGNAPTGPGNRPNKEISIKKLTFSDKEPATVKK